ncbi:MAG: hypothetical protein JO147_08945 [Actinobacteria bacterium]|nr:hypothetical protein [Actinomycetota bacterium]
MPPIEPSDAVPRRRRPDRHDGDEGPVLPSVTRDEQNVGWGERDDERDDDWYLRERPPHHE